jgi:hypothetical protein
MNLNRLNAGVVLGLGLAGVSRGEDLSLKDERLELKGPSIKIEAVDGRDAIVADSGVAYRRDLRVEDGTFEMDVRLSGKRSFVYVMFRMQDDQEYEEIYLRPHKSGLPDAVQYAPVYQGQSAWQLHHGPGATAALDIPAGGWVRLRLVLSGSRAALFLGNEEKPALLVNRLFRPSRAGYLAVRSFVPAGTPGGEPAARFAGLRVLPGVVGYTFPPIAPGPAPGAGIIPAWAVSQALKPAEGSVPGPPDAAALLGLRRVAAEADGLVEMHRHVRVPAGTKDTTAAARVFVKAASEGLRALDLGWSDEATVFLNGRPVFRGDASYSFDTPRRDGLIGYDQARLFLPLRAGENELLVVVKDGFGGMGLMGRFPDPTGLTLDPR